MTKRMSRCVATYLMVTTFVAGFAARCGAGEVTIRSHEVFCRDADLLAKCDLAGGQEGSPSPYPILGWFGLDHVGPAQRGDFLEHCGSGGCQVTLRGAQAEPGGYIDRPCITWTAKDGDRGEACAADATATRPR